MYTFRIALIVSTACLAGCALSELNAKGPLPLEYDRVINDVNASPTGSYSSGSGAVAVRKLSKKSKTYVPVDDSNKNSGTP